jgi:hypothetical protein
MLVFIIFLFKKKKKPKTVVFKNTEKLQELGMEANVCNPQIQEAEAGRLLSSKPTWTTW